MNRPWLIRSTQKGKELTITREPYYEGYKYAHQARIIRKPPKIAYSPPLHLYYIKKGWQFPSGGDENDLSRTKGS